MKIGSLFLFFFCVSVAAIVLKEGAVDAGRVLKERNIATGQADKNPCDHHNLINGVGSILKNKLPSGPSPGVGHKYIDSFGPVKMKTSDAAINTLKINKLPSGPSGGVGHKYINAAGSMKTSDAATNTLKINKLPSGPSGGVGHKYINAAGYMKPSAVPAQTLITTTPFNKFPSGPSGGVGHSYND